MNAHQRRIRRRAVERWHREVTERFLTGPAPVILTLSSVLPSDADVMQFKTMLQDATEGKPVTTIYFDEVSHALPDPLPARRLRRSGPGDRYGL